jgi:hypothetical protein
MHKSLIQNSLKQLSFCAAALGAALLAHPITDASAQTPAANNPAIGITAGTLGLGGEISFKIIGNFVVRLTAGGANYSFTKNAEGADYRGKISGFNAGLIGDWHPFENGFRLSGGARYVNAEFLGSTTGANLSIGGHTYTPAQYGTLSLSLKNGNSVAPYLGLGWDSAHYATSSWAFAVDFGAMYLGDPRVSLTATGTAAGLAADLVQQEQKLKDSVGKYGRFYPVAQLAAKYRF